MHVVFGASGRVGGETARALIDRDEQVRVVVRHPEQGEAWQALGAEVAIASLDNVEQVSAALAGASTAFLLNPPPAVGDPFAQAARIAAVLAEALRRTSLPKAVILSSIGAQHASGTGVIATLHQIENALTGIAPATAFLRPGYFVETWSEAAGSAISDGILPSFLELDQKIPMVSTVNVGRAASRLMTETWTAPRVVQLSGSEDWSARDVARAFAEVLGHPVEPAFVPVSQREAVLADAGLPAEVAAALLGMYEGIADGHVFYEDGIEHWHGTTSLKAAVERIVAKHRAPALAEGQPV